MKDRYVMGIVGIVCYTAIGIVAMLQGIDSGVLVTVGTAIGAAIGLGFGVRLKKD